MPSTSTSGRSSSPATNAAAAGLGNVRGCLPDEVPPDVRFDLIWSNPPIRVGKEALHDLLGTWLPRLTEEGEAYLVVQKNLGADSLQRWVRESLGNAVRPGRRREGIPGPAGQSGSVTVPSATRTAGPASST